MEPLRANAKGELRQSARLVTVGACLAATYVVFVSTPATTAFYKDIGAKDHHFALIAGVSMVMLSLQFVGAVLTNRLSRRKPVFIAVHITQRLLHIPIAFLPLAFPSIPANTKMVIIIAILGLNSALTHVGYTLFRSWVADLIPHRILNRYWGGRQLWMNITILICYLLVAAVIWWAGQRPDDWPVTTVFPILVVAAVIPGMIDILLFLRVKEPEHAVVRDQHPIQLLLEPILCPTYRSFLLFQCVWLGSTVIAGAFMQIYVLKVLEVEVWHATLIWALHIVGSTLTCKLWGRVADEHGHKPILTVCLTLKPVVALTFLLVTKGTALWVLPLALLLDGTLNAGLGVATNGYSMKMAPRKNRSMFLAAASGSAGIVAGGMAFLAGGVLKSLEGWSVDWMGRTWINFQVLFAVSFVLRILCNIWVRTIREPESSHPIHVLQRLLPIRPWGWVRPPVYTDEDIVEVED
ncbi:MAG: MFS transporter [Planctomycetota bacterium]|jgi:MFS family permease